MLPVNHSSAIDRLLDYVPDLMEKANNILNKQINNKKEEKKEHEKKEERHRKEEKESIIEENSNIIVPNTIKMHPKRNRPKEEFNYDEIEE